MTGSAPVTGTTAGTGRPRLAAPDVTRAIALIGVIVLNYHGYLNGAAARAGAGDSWAARLFDPWEGVLATRFAATFVLVAGLGVTLLTDRARNVAEPIARDTAISEVRWRLVRRGTLLLVVGGLLDWAWDGTILPFYGAMFLLAAIVFPMRTGALVAVGASTFVGAAALRWWVVDRTAAGREPRWLLEPDTLASRSPRGAVFDLFVNGTHPLLPWFGFLVGGMVVGRALPWLQHRTRPIGVAIAATAVTLATYAVSDAVTPHVSRPTAEALLSTRPGDRALLYSIGTLATAVAAYTLVAAVGAHASRKRSTASLHAAAAAGGRFSLSIYFLHVAVYVLLVDQAGLIDPTGLDTAALFGVTVWLTALLVAPAWEGRWGRGPAEWIYRRFGA